MTTYEQGRAPEGAPRVWSKAQAEYSITGNAERFLFDAELHDDSEMDTICRAFHAAQEARAIIGTLTTDAAQQWIKEFT